MTIFSGFPTRKLQQKYNHYVFSLLQLFQNQILISYEYIDQTQSNQFKNKLTKIVYHLSQMEKNKYLQPKFTQSITPLLQKLQINTTDTTSDLNISILKSSQLTKDKNNRKILSSRNSFQKVKSRQSTSRKRTGNEQISEGLNFENMEMQQILKRRPQLPKRNLSNIRQKKMTDIEIIQQSDEQQIQSKQNIKQWRKRGLDLEENNLDKYYIRRKKY